MIPGFWRSCAPGVNSWFDRAFYHVSMPRGFYTAPPPPEAPRFDPVRGAWTLSRYADVSAALREPALVQASAQNRITGVDPSEVHAKVQADMARLSAVELRMRMERDASAIIARAAHGRPVDLVKEIIQPWSVAATLALDGTAPEHASRLTSIAGRLFFNVSQPTTRAVRRKWLAWRRKAAAAELERMIQRRSLSLSHPMFSGLTQTLPSFLAAAWLALLQHPDQMAKLLAQPDLMPGALEELLRHAGIVHTLHRQASRDVCVGEANIVLGQSVILRMNSANHDPAKFADPHRLDITRRPSGHLGLGTGLYACAGAVLVRSAFTIVTPLFLAARPTLDPRAPIIWTSDTSIQWPRAITAKFP
jgi:cytochrome P450